MSGKIHKSGGKLLKTGGKLRRCCCGPPCCTPALGDPIPVVLSTPRPNAQVSILARGRFRRPSQSVDFSFNQTQTRNMDHSFAPFSGHEPECSASMQHVPSLSGTPGEYLDTFAQFTARGHIGGFAGGSCGPSMDRRRAHFIGGCAAVATDPNQGIDALTGFEFMYQPMNTGTEFSWRFTREFGGCDDVTEGTFDADMPVAGVPTRFTLKDWSHEYTTSGEILDVDELVVHFLDIGPCQLEDGDGIRIASGEETLRLTNEDQWGGRGCCG